MQSPDATSESRSFISLPFWALLPDLLWQGARLSEESRAAEDMIARFSQWQRRKPQSIAADASYGNGEFLQWLMDREITPYMPTRDAVGRTRSPFYGPECLLTYPKATATSVRRISS
jgi:hypothetical protein